jgi:uncharacterized protein with FMN-binding domain
MRKVAAALAATAAGLIALLSFRSHGGTETTLLPAGGTAAQSSAGASGAAGDGGAAVAGASSSPAALPRASSSPAAPRTTAPAAGKSGSFTGTVASTMYGPVQVSITVASGKLTNVKVLQVPDNGRYEENIVAQAIPELTSEALSAQSARIDSISGATFTSQGYMTSLQSALDQAGI